MDTLWAPWRSRFIISKKKKACIFCLKNKAASKRYVIKKSKFSFALLNAYPYNNGHIMVSPYRHVKDLKGLREAELLNMVKLVREMQILVEKRLKPHGFNLGINVGKVSGAGYNHIHVHIVPRWRGDTNFMPVTGDAKVMPQSLQEMHRLLTKS